MSIQIYDRIDGNGVDGVDVSTSGYVDNGLSGGTHYTVTTLRGGAHALLTATTPQAIRAADNSGTSMASPAVIAPADCRVEGLLLFPDASVCQLGVLGRTDNTSFTAGYMALSLLGNLYLIKGGGGSTLASASFPVSPPSIHHIALEMVGTSLIAYGDGVPLVTATDATTSAAGYAGFEIISGGTAPDDVTGTQLLRFAVVSVGGTAAISAPTATSPVSGAVTISWLPLYGGTGPASYQLQRSPDNSTWTSIGPSTFDWVGSDSGQVGTQHYRIQATQPGPVITNSPSIAVNFGSSTLAAGDLIMTPAGPSITISTTTTGGTGSNSYVLGGDTNLAASLPLATLQTNGSGTFTVTPGDDLIRQFAIRTTDSSTAVVTTSPQLGARQYATPLRVGLIGDSTYEDINPLATVINQNPDWSMPEGPVNTTRAGWLAFRLAKLLNRKVILYEYGYSGSASRDWMKGVVSAGHNFPTYSSNLLYDQTLADWTALGKPDVIGVNLGINDYSNTALFAPNMTAIVASLKADYPSSKIQLWPVEPAGNAPQTAAFVGFNATLLGLVDGVRVFTGDYFQAAVSNQRAIWTYSETGSTGDEIHPNESVGYPALGNMQAADLYRRIISPVGSGSTTMISTGGFNGGFST